MFHYDLRFAKLSIFHCSSFVAFGSFLNSFSALIHATCDKGDHISLLLFAFSKLHSIGYDLRFLEKGWAG